MGKRFLDGAIPQSRFFPMVLQKLHGGTDSSQSGANPKIRTARIKSLNQIYRNICEFMAGTTQIEMWFLGLNILLYWYILMQLACAVKMSSPMTKGTVGDQAIWVEFARKQQHLAPTLSR